MRNNNYEIHKEDSNEETDNESSFISETDDDIKNDKN